MDIKAILTSNGIEEEAAEKLAKAINKVVGDEFVDKQRYKDKLEEIVKLQTDLKTAEDALSTAETWKTKYDDEVKAHGETKTTVAAEKEAAETAELLRKGLETKGANKKAVDLLIKDIDTASVKKKDGAITNLDEVLNPIMEKYADFFGETCTEGAEVGKNIGGGLNPYAGKSATELMRFANERPNELDAIMDHIQKSQTQQNKKE